MKVITVIPLTKGMNTENLTYFTSKKIEIGNIVTITIKNKKTLGLVISSSNINEIKSDIKDLKFNLKKIIDVKEKSIFKKEYIESIFEINKYYVSKINNSLTSLIPSILKEKYGEIIPYFIEEKINITNKLLNEKLIFQESFKNRISYYKTYIRNQFALKKSIFLILPTIEDIKEWNDILSKGIEQFTYTFHSDIKDKIIIENIKNILKEEHSILIIATPQYLSLPINKIETIILENESSNAYKMISKPYFDFRIFAEIYAKKINSKFIIGDNLISFENLKRYNEGEYNSIDSVSYRIERNPEIIINDIEKEKTFSIFKENDIKNILEATHKKENVFIFALRKGLGALTICNDCGHHIFCNKCNAPFILYSLKNKSRKFMCNRCGTEKNTEIVCPDCTSWNLKTIGIGTDTVFHELKEKLPKIEIHKLNKEEVKNTKEAQKIIKEWEENKGSILIGTEMALFYIKNKISTSIIASFDSLFSIPNYKISEKIIHLLINILNITKDKLIINTKNTEDKSITSLKQRNILSFIREEMKDREDLNYPPYMRFIKITYIDEKNKMEKTKEFLENLFKEYQPIIYSGFINKIKNKYILHTLIKIDLKKWSFSKIGNNLNIDENLYNKLNSLPSSFSIQIDPDDLL